MLDPKSSAAGAVPHAEASRAEAMARIGVARGVFVAPPDSDVLNDKVLALLRVAGGMLPP